MTGADDRPWRGPGELRGAGPTPEFPPAADVAPTVSRRDLLQTLGAGAALAGASGCSRGAPRDILPYVTQPPEITPSQAIQYATTMTLDGYGVGMLVRANEGWPTKAEGNPHHPASGGALGTFGQACVLDLYDPQRARAPTYQGTETSWRAFVDAISRPAATGRKTHVLLEPTGSPHLIELIDRLRAQGAVVWFHTALSRSNAWEGGRLAFGRVVEPAWDFARADVVVSLDADFLGDAHVPAPWVRAWADRRATRLPRDPSRLYAVEGRLSLTGMAADERLRVQSRQVAGVAADLLAVLLGHVADGVPDGIRSAAAARAGSAHGQWTAAVARDLAAHRGASLVVAGDAQPPAVHALAAAMNAVLGNTGRTVSYLTPCTHEAGGASHGLAPLCAALDAGTVGTLLIVGGDPAYTGPVDLDFAWRIRSASVAAFVGPRRNRTATVCDWCAPEAHFLEAWSDARAFDGTPSIAQPLVAPLGQGKTAGQVLAALLGMPDADSMSLVRGYWRKRTRGGDFDALWRRALALGVVDRAPPASPADVAIDWRPAGQALAAATAPAAPLEIVYFADAKVHDGRFADAACLQELADPVTKLTWDNAALVGPATASLLGVATEDAVEVEVRGRTLRAAVLVCPTMADGVVALALGYGQEGPGRLSEGVGASAYAVRDSHAAWSDDARMHKTGDTWQLAITQEHWSMEGRPIVLWQTAAEARRDPRFAAPRNEPTLSLYGGPPRTGHQWGMTIDLSRCTGCSACVVACMAENNVPVVGKGGVRLSREMHWLRLDRYFVGAPDDARVVVQPMLCQHCERAPCEYVCPVNATVHSADGLNEMVYNRCVGTRFC
ncbi:MAG: 4Fe-4S dicluster domain-containing protein, partial [Polyangiaceae bacterium]